eukprot:5522162-Karenia_brevis.AAC.1
MARYNPIGRSPPSSLGNSAINRSLVTAGKSPKPSTMSRIKAKTSNASSDNNEKCLGWNPSTTA